MNFFEIEREEQGTLASKLAKDYGWKLKELQDFGADLGVPIPSAEHKLHPSEVARLNENVE